jgi:hypothetical protein
MDADSLPPDSYTRPERRFYDPAPEVTYQEDEPTFMDTTPEPHNHDVPEIPADDTPAWEDDDPFDATDLSDDERESLEEELLRLYYESQRNQDLERARHFFRSRSAGATSGSRRNTSGDWQSVRDRVLARDRYICRNCRRDADDLFDWDSELDAYYIVPRYRGGQHHLDNLVTLCTECRALMLGES